jgi:hypothetical protein
VTSAAHVILASLRRCPASPPPAAAAPLGSTATVARCQSGLAAGAIRLRIRQAGPLVSATRTLVVVLQQAELLARRLGEAGSEIFVCCFEQGLRR